MILRTRCCFSSSLLLSLMALARYLPLMLRAQGRWPAALLLDCAPPPPPPHSVGVLPLGSAACGPCRLTSLARGLDKSFLKDALRMTFLRPLHTLPVQGWLYCCGLSPGAAGQPGLYSSPHMHGVCSPTRQRCARTLKH